MRLKHVIAIVVTVLVGLIATKYEDKSLPSDHQSIPLLHCIRCSIIQTVLGTQDNDDRCAVNGGESLVDLQLPLRFVAYVASTVTKFQHEGKIEHHCSSLKTNSDRMLVIKTSK